MLLVYIVFDLAPVTSNAGDTKVLLRPEHIIGMIPDSVTPQRTVLLLSSGKSVCVAHTPEQIGAKFGEAKPRVVT